MGKKRRDGPRVTAQHLRRQERLRALVAREKTQRMFADKHGLSWRHLSQMLAKPGSKGWRGVGDDIVEKLETDAALRLPRGWFDAMEISEPTVAWLAESRPKNNVRALRIALQCLFSRMHETQQGEAEALAREIVEMAGTQLVGQSFLSILVGTLLGVPGMSEEDLRGLLQSPVLPASKHEVSAVK
jgi:hypothetical protein